jgi:hypothetical protein
MELSPALSMFVSYGALSGTMFVSYGALSGTMFESYGALFTCRGSMVEEPCVCERKSVLSRGFLYWITVFHRTWGVDDVRRCRLWFSAPSLPSPLRVSLSLVYCFVDKTAPCLVGHSIPYRKTKKKDRDRYQDGEKTTNANANIVFVSC